VSAQLKRIEKSQKFLAIKRLLLAIPWIDSTLHAAFIGYLLIFGRFSKIQSVILIASALLSCSFTYALRARLAWPNNSFRAAAWLRLRDMSAQRTLATALIGVLGPGRLFLVLVGVTGLTITVKAPEFDWLLAILALSFIYIPLWSASALTSAALGSFIGPWWWPLLPVVMPARLVTVAWRRFTSREVWAEKILPALIAGTLVGGSIAALLTILVILLDRAMNQIGSQLSHSWIASHPAVGSGLLLLSLGLLFVWVLWRVWLQLARPWIRLHNWSKALPTTIDGRQLLMWIRSMRTRSQLLGLIQLIRRERLIWPDSDALQAIYDLFLAAEHLSRRSHKKKEEAKKHGLWSDLYGLREELRESFHWKGRGKKRIRREFWPQFNTDYMLDWIDEYASPNSRQLRAFTPDVLDEMSRIVEDIKRSPTQAMSNVQV
jgi:hypothetical protein